MAVRRAKGIPDRSVKGDPANLPVGVPLTVVEQLHEAKRAGTHTDFRMGTPSIGMFSWAVPKGLPKEPGEKRLAVTQPVHSYSYNDFEGVIGKGYGAGRVTLKDKGELVLLSKSPGHIKFTRSDRRNAPVYSMVRTPNNNWLIFIQKEDLPDTILHYDKERFRSVSPAAVKAIMGEGAIATPKLDGAAALAYLGRKGIDVYGVRRDKDGNLIRYTDHIGGLRGHQVPEELVGKVLRGEVIAERQGRVLPPQEVSGYLNSSLGRALDRRRQGTRLRLAALGMIENGAEDYDPGKVADVVRRLGSPEITLPPVYDTPDKAVKALSLMKAGKHPLTSEGLVVHPKGGRPLKAKITEDADVVIRDILPGKAEVRAGGFSYSLDEKGPEVGRVGSGMDFSTLRDMLENPDAYKGRIARIRSLGQFPGGAHRSPSFIALHEG